MKRTVILALLLSGCAEMEERRGMQQLLREQALDQSQDAKCQGFGAKPGTQAYISCRMQLDGQQSAEDAQQRAMVTQYLLNRQ